MELLRSTQTKSLFLSAFLLGVVLAAWWSSEALSKHAPSGGRKAEDQQIGYPPGPWWRGDFSRTMAGVAHILVAHEQSQPTDEMLPPVVSPPRRSRSDALARALLVSQKARAHPERFQSLVDAYSDDRSTATYDGIIGDVYLRDLPRAFVDAVGNLSVGQCSYPVETPLGFHVLKRLAVNSKAQYSAQEILISHNGSSAPILESRQGRRTPQEAAERARVVAAKAMSSPGQFARLVAEYSDGYTAAQQGSRGTWDNYTAHTDPLVTTALRALKIGQISPPLLTNDGYLVLKRVSPGEDEAYAMAGLIVPYRRGRGLESANVTANRSEAQAEAERILRIVRDKPNLLSGYQDQYCAGGLCVTRVSAVRERDRYSAGLYSALRDTAIGSFISTPVDTPSGFFVAQRVEAAKAAPVVQHEPVFELPVPEPLTLHSATADELRWYLGELQASVMTSLELTDSERRELQAAFKELADQLPTSQGPKREEVVMGAARGFALLLGPRRALQISHLNDRLLLSLSGVATGTH